MSINISDTDFIKPHCNSNKLYSLFTLNNKKYEFSIYEDLVYPIGDFEIKEIYSDPRCIHLKHMITSTEIKKLSNEDLGYGHQIKIGNLYKSSGTTMVLVTHMSMLDFSWCDIHATDGLVESTKIYAIIAELLDLDNKIPEKKYFFFMPNRHKEGFFALNHKTLVST